MDALSFLKFWRHVTITNHTILHVLGETDNESDEEDSFFDLKLTVGDFDTKEDNTRRDKNIGEPEDKTMRESEGKHLPLSSNEPISKRKIHPIEPISKPQSPISLLKSAPSFRISIFKKPKEKTGEARFFEVKLNMDEESRYNSPSLSRANSSRSYGSKSKPERFSKDVLQKYVKLIKPLYLKFSKKYGEEVKFSGEASSDSPMSSPSVSLRKERQGNIPAVRKRLGKRRSESGAAGVASPAKRSDDSWLEQHDGIQSAILHCKRSFNSRGEHLKT